MNLFEAYSYSNPNISSHIIELQKRVFEKYKLPITQIVENSTHGDFLNKTIKNCKSEIVILFDIDSIPLTQHLYDILINELQKEPCIIGIEQKCNSNPHNHTYAGPGCLALSKSLYYEIGCPDLNQNGQKSDVGEELTWKCEEKNIKVKLLTCTSVEIPKWNLDNTRSFGIGTTYSFNNIETVYHQFEIRTQTQNFVDKCYSILNNE